MAALDAFKAGGDVEIDVVAVSDQERRRIVDLLSGASYALDATMERIAKHVFLLTMPAPPGGKLGGVREPRRPHQPSASGAATADAAPGMGLWET